MATSRNIFTIKGAQIMTLQKADFINSVAEQKGYTKEQAIFQDCQNPSINHQKHS
jgi:hypothetical protein